MSTPSTPAARELTQRQHTIWLQIVDYQLQYGNYPTVRQLCGLNGDCSSNAIYDHLKVLVRKGYLTRRNDKTSMNIRLLRYPYIDLCAYGPDAHVTQLLQHLKEQHVDPSNLPGVS